MQPYFSAFIDTVDTIKPFLTGKSTFLDLSRPEKWNIQANSGKQPAISVLGRSARCIAMRDRLSDETLLLVALGTTHSFPHETSKTT